MSKKSDAAQFNTVIDVEDHTANIVPDSDRDKGSQDIQDAQQLAKDNFAAEQKNNSSEPLGDFSTSPEVADAQALAKANYKAEQDAGVAGHVIAKNDTDAAAKKRTSKSQLDPSGNDPISDAEVNRAATDGVNVKGETAVSDKEVAARAADPGTAEEQNPISTAADGVDKEQLKPTEGVLHTNSNEGKDTGEGGMADIVGPANRTVEGRDTDSKATNSVETPVSTKTAKKGTKAGSK
jgi:hypothetical protein